MKVANFISSMDYRTSISANVLAVSEKLSAMGHQVSLYTTYPEQEDLPSNFGQVSINYYPAIFQFKSFRFSLKMLKAYGSIDADIIHLYDSRCFETFSATLLKLKRKSFVPFVISAHGTIPYVYTFSDKLMKLFFDASTLKLSLKLADIILAETKFEANQLTDFGIPARKIKCIYGKVDTDLFRKTQRNFFGSNKKVVLYVGRVNRIKGIEGLLQAFSIVSSKCPNVKLLIVGPIEDINYLNELKLLTKSLSIENNVNFYGSVPHDALPDFYSSATVLVLPSLWENLGNVLIEAQACECPVISTNIGGTNEVLIDGETGYLAALGNFRQMADKMLLFITNDEMRSSFGRKARDYVLRNFSPDAYARRILCIYEDILKSNKTKRVMMPRVNDLIAEN